jgi:hypothetical protein
MDCDVIKDLIPLYIEKLASESSNHLIEEHVKNCVDCTKTLYKLQSEITTDNKEVEFVTFENPPDKLIKRIKKNIYEKILIAVLITLVIGILIGILSAKIFMFLAFLGSISIIAFTIGIFVSLPICRKKSSLRKQFKVLGNWVFLFSILICIFCFFIFSWYFNDTGKIQSILILEILYNLILTLTLRIYAGLKLPKDDIVDGRNPLHKKLFIVTFITLISIVTFITVPVTLLETNRVVDNINLPFVNDSDILGKWQSVDTVTSLKQFNPDRPHNIGNLFLREIIFLENGRLRESFANNNTKDIDIPTPWLSWTKGVVMDMGGNHTASKYITKEINGSKYMFYEWKTSDYFYFHSHPNYYVLKKVSN